MQQIAPSGRVTSLVITYFRDILSFEQIGIGMAKKSFVNDYANIASPETVIWASQWISELRNSGLMPELLHFRGRRQLEFREYLKKIGATASSHLLFLDVLHLVMNETISILLAAQEPYSDQEKFGQNSKEKSMISLMMTLSSCFEGARMLIGAGNDHSARILARTISESSDLLLILSFDEEIAQKYVESSEDFQVFWSKYIARGKLATLKKAALHSKGGVPLELVQSALSYSGEEFKAFSQAVHPSYLGGVMQLLLLFNDSEGELAFLNEWPCQRVCRYILDSVGTALAIVLPQALVPSGISSRVNEKNQMPCSDQMILNLASGALSACTFAALAAQEAQQRK